MADPRSSWAIVLWDVASRRELRTFGGPAGRILALAFSPDGKTLATTGADRGVRFWDVASGREDRRIDGAGSGRALAFSPDGQTLAIDRRPVAPSRCGMSRATACAPRSSRRPSGSPSSRSPSRRMAGRWPRPARPSTRRVSDQQGQVRLYDLSREPFARRAVLTFDGDWRGPAGRTTRSRCAATSRSRPTAAGSWRSRCTRSGSGTRRPGPSRTPSGAGHVQLVRPPRRLARRPMAGDRPAHAGLRPGYPLAGAMIVPGSNRGCQKILARHPPSTVRQVPVM